MMNTRLLKILFIGNSHIYYMKSLQYSSNCMQVNLSNFVLNRSRRLLPCFCLNAIALNVLISCGIASGFSSPVDCGEDRSTGPRIELACPAAGA